MALPGGHFFGAVTLGAARIAFIDTGEDKQDGHKEYSGLVDFDRYITRQMEWLSDEFASTAWKDAPFRIVVMHIPPAGTFQLGGGRWPGGTERMGRLSALLKGANVSLALAAHLHRSANDNPNADHPYPVIVGGGPREEPEERRKAFGDATLTRCDYDADELVVVQTNIRGERLFERHIKAVVV